MIEAEEPAGNRSVVDLVGLIARNHLTRQISSTINETTADQDLEALSRGPNWVTWPPVSEW
jgi:hypothetical protein